MQNVIIQIVKLSINRMILGLPAREDGTGIPGVLYRIIPIESIDVKSWSVWDPEPAVAPVAQEFDLDREVSINPEQIRSDIW